MKKILIVLTCVYGVFGASSVSQYGITWEFDRDYTTGRFANGDYWVVGPVVITEITPEFDGSWNGWQVNPLPNQDHGFKEDCYGGEHFDPELVPDLPFTANPDTSIIKTIANGSDDRPCLKTAAVLTVVAEVPPDSGAAVFRPPYIGSNKPYYYVEDILLDSLPSHKGPEERVTLEWIYNRFGMMQMDHLGGRMTQGLRPEDNMPNYGGNIGTDEGEAAVRLMLDDPIADKMDPLIAYLQYGIDLHHMILLGQTWPSGGGEMPCHTLPWVFAAYLLNNQDMRTYVSSYREEFYLYNDLLTYRGKNDKALFGQTHHSYSEGNYWECVENSSNGNKTQADPYGYIDGGPVPGDYYQECCTSQPWKTQMLAFHLMPEMKEIWWNQTLSDYVDRWVTHGAWTQPDPCAPLSQGGGPNPERPGECILDPDLVPGSTFDDFECQEGKECGRFPERHGALKNGGLRGSDFIDAMWEMVPVREPGIKRQARNYSTEYRSFPNALLQIADLKEISRDAEISVYNLKGECVKRFVNTGDLVNKLRNTEISAGLYLIDIDPGNSSCYYMIRY